MLDLVTGTLVFTPSLETPVFEPSSETESLVLELMQARHLPASVVVMCLLVFVAELETSSKVFAVLGVL